MHAVMPDQLHGVALLVNGQQLSAGVWVRPDGHRLAASVPQGVLRQSDATNRIEIVVPHVVRPCDVSSTNPDSRTLGLAIGRVALLLVPSADAAEVQLRRRRIWGCKMVYSTRPSMAAPMGM